MTVVFIRTFIIYFVISAVMRIMGKRQVGELEVSELISALLLSEIAAMPIENPDLPISYAIIPLVAIVCFEIIITFSKTKIVILKKIFENKPSIIIKRGKLDQEELGKMRISLEELLGELRIKGITDISDVEYAILEQNGKLSIIPRTEKMPATVEDLKLSFTKKGIAHPLLIDGQFNEYNMRDTGKDKNWILKRIKDEKCNLNDVFLMTIDDDQNVNIIKREKQKNKKKGRNK